MRKKKQYPTQSFIAYGRFIFKNDNKNEKEEFYEIEIYGPTVNMQLLEAMSAIIKPGQLPIAIHRSLTDIDNQSKQNYQRPQNEYGKNIPDEKFTKLLEVNNPKTSAGKVFKSSSGYLNKKQETQEEMPVKFT